MKGEESITKGSKKNKHSPSAISGSLRRNDSDQNYKARIVNEQEGRKIRKNAKTLIICF